MPPRTTRSTTRNRNPSAIPPANPPTTPVAAEQPNPFAVNAQSFAPYSESISALGNIRRRPSAFGPAIASLAEVTTETALGESGYIYRTVYDEEGRPIQVRTPRGDRTAVPVVVPPETVDSPTLATFAGQRRSLAVGTNPLLSRTPSRTRSQPASRAVSREPSRGRSQTRRSRSGEENPRDHERGNNPGDPDDGDDGGGGGGGGGGPGGPPGGGPPGQGRDEEPDREGQALQLFAAFQQSIDGLSTALGNLRGEGSDSGKAKVKDPDVFDGSDPRKLKTFLVSLSLVFLDRPNYFTDQRKISYTLSYLGGSAREWFEPDILDPDINAMPTWTRTFSALVQELQDNFGLYDAQGEAEEKLGNLRMKENEPVRKYNIRFNSLAVSTNWDSSALKWAYQRGLASRIKDEMVHVAEPANLSEYRKEVLRIDNRYWRREEERKRESNRTTPQSKPNSSAKKGNSSASTSVSVNVTPTSGNQSSENQNRKGGNRSNKGGAGQSSGQSPKSSNNSASRPPRPHERFLGPDGKLKPEELERRRKFNLCLFCGEKHKFEDCNKRKQSNQPRGRAAATQEPTSELPAIAEVPEN